MYQRTEPFTTAAVRALNVYTQGPVIRRDFLTRQLLYFLDTQTSSGAEYVHTGTQLYLITYSCIEPTGLWSLISHDRLLLFSLLNDAFSI
jgi:hypothetical protein